MFVLMLRALFSGLDQDLSPTLLQIRKAYSYILKTGEESINLILYLIN